jgi:type VI secretion system protein VasD
MAANRLGFRGFGAASRLAHTFGIAGLLIAPSCSHAPPRARAPAAPAAAPSPCKTPQPLRVNLTATASLNPGEKGEALATVVRLYQLKGVSKLTGVSFDDLLDRDKETLGEDFLGVQEITINPGERLSPPIVRNPEAGFLLAVALFRRPAGTTWKVSTRLRPADPDYCRVEGDRARSDGMIRLFLDENRLELR